MTLSNDYDDNLTAKTDISIGSTNLESLYCSHLWSNSILRKAILNASTSDKEIQYCNTCKGKIRKYDLKAPNVTFVPNDHSTPNGKFNEIEPPTNSIDDSYQIFHSNKRHPLKDNEAINLEMNEHIPSISRQIDSSFRQKYTSYELRPNDDNQRRLRKSLRGIGCIVNFSLTDSPVKKRTQIQACSISVMIVAIVVISFVLVNFTTPNFTRATNIASTILVPTKKLESNKSSSTVTNIYSNSNLLMDVGASTTEYSATNEPFHSTTENVSLISSVISKIRKNIRTYPKEIKREQNNYKSKEINNRDLSDKFCSCQNNEVCMLEENSGTALCKEAIDIDDPTGCGGLCALETEACQLVDKVRGVRVCRLLTLVTCSPQEWRCQNGLCVRAENRCDGSIQCYDRSDELHCDCDLTKQFRCGHSISCFSNTKLCDGFIDCWDGYDEVNCTAECPKDQFTCTDGQCIPGSRFCDGFADCADNSDEPHGCDGDCGAHEIRCKNHRCVPRAAHCDGYDNCGDATDEIHCSR